jgi:acetyl-CoA synthetase
MSEADDEAAILWRPRAEDVRRAHLTQVLADNGAATYAELIALLAHDDAAFEAYYAALISRLDLTWTRPWTALRDTSQGMPFSRWFVGASFNAPANCLDRWIARGRGEAEALVWEDEAGNTGVLTFRQLYVEVVRLGVELQRLGVARGDSVGIWLPMAPEAAIALLAVGYIGAIAVPAFSGYGSEALAARFADAGARVILAFDGIQRRGKVLGTLETLRDALALMPGKPEVVLLPRRGEAERTFVAPPDAAQSFDTAADEAYLLLYTSGSSGKPKGGRPSACGCCADRDSCSGGTRRDVSASA